MLKRFVIGLVAIAIVIGLGVPKERSCVISFGDSGLGGLLFAYDVYLDTNKDLEALEKRYALDIQFRHIGDSKHAPYGLKTPEKIRELAHGLVDTMQSTLDADYAIMACNTASSVMDEKFMKTVENKYGDIKVLPILNESAQALYDAAKVVQNPTTGLPELHIAILSTVATQKSDVYPKLIRQIHAHHPQQRLMELHIYTYSPEEWVSIIESEGLVPKLESEVSSDLYKMSQQFPNLNDVSAVGLFCTHFALVEASIADYFAQHFGTSPVLLSQGSLFSENVMNFVEWYVAQNSVPRRWWPQNSSMTITSYITGRNAPVIEGVMLRIDPLLKEVLSVITI